jgi:hypothetical protein
VAVEALRIGRQLALAGMEAVDAAESEAWRNAADWALNVLVETGRPFTAEDICALAGRPSRPNAIGARIHAAARRGRIERCGYARSTRPSRRASVVAVWRAARE